MNSSAKQFVLFCPAIKCLCFAWHGTVCSSVFRSTFPVPVFRGSAPYPVSGKVQTPGLDILCQLLFPVIKNTLLSGNQMPLLRMARDRMFVRLREHLPRAGFPGLCPISRSFIYLFSDDLTTTSLIKLYNKSRGSESKRHLIFPAVHSYGSGMPAAVYRPPGC